MQAQSVAGTQAIEVLKSFPGTSLAVQWLGAHLPMQGVPVRPLVGELRFSMPQYQTEHRNNIVTHSIKTLKDGPPQKKKNVCVFIFKLEASLGEF